ncbi:STY4528 family pathogenicity island replication protein [Ursidibacter sp. B-7004-1]
MELRKSINHQAEFARKKLSEKKEQNSEENGQFQGLLFIGNRHETVPLRLLTDKYLTPRAKTAWQMIKLNAQQFQGAAFPSYEELGYWLSDRAFQNKTLSRKTISQTLLLLRLTRWLTLCETVRNERGQILGNVYVMNDEPLSISDCLQINGDYLRLLEKSKKHSDPLIKEVADAIIGEIEAQQSLSHFVSHLGVITERYLHFKEGFVKPRQITELTPNIAEAIENVQKDILSSNLELCPTADNLPSSNMELSQKIDNLPSSNMELSQKTDKSPSSNMELSKKSNFNSLILKEVPNWNSVDCQYSTSTNSIKYSTSTDLSLENLQLSILEKNTISKELEGLSDELRKAVLFEAEQRISQGSVKKPVGYLTSLIYKAKAGLFKPYLINKSPQIEHLGKMREVSHPAKRVLSSTIPDKDTQVSQDFIKKLAQMVRT